MNVLDVLRPFASHSSQQRGWEYLNRVQGLEGDAQRVSAKVYGHDSYDVVIRVDGKNLRVSCSCPYFDDRGNVCKHLWATAVRAEEKKWLTDLPTGLRVVMDFPDLEDHDLFIVEGRDLRTPFTRSTSVRRSASTPEWLVALSEVTASSARERSLAARDDAQLLYILTAPERGTLTELPLVVEKRVRKRNGEWSKPRPSRLTMNDIAHLPDADDRWALSLIYSSSSFPRDAGSYGYALASQPLSVIYLKSALIDMLLPRLCATGRLRLRQAADLAGAAKRTEEDIPLEWDGGEPWRFRLAITAAEANATPRSSTGQPGYRVDAMLTRGERRESIHEFMLLTDSIAVLGDVVSPFNPDGGLTWAKQLRERGEIVVPAEARGPLVESIASSPVQHVDLPDDLQWQERIVPPRFCATIAAPRPYDSACTLDLSVDYEGIRAPMDGGVRLVSPDGRVMYRRNHAAEQDAFVMLKRHGVAGLEAEQGEDPFIGARRLPGLVHALVARGWLVDAEGVRYRNVAAPRLHIRSGIDWFEVAAVDDAGAVVDLPELIKALNAGRRTVTLGDGSIGMLPEKWLEQVAPVLTLGEMREDGLRFKPSQVALLDALLADQPEVDWDEGFARARGAMQRFEGLRAEDPPPTFHGVLREYQRESLGWMRFLRDFGFGGCLADDMGLGKTVMVLAMLDTRRLDTTRPHRPSLAVLPRSLLFNWTTEASRFAPQLRILDFAHADRHSAMDAIPATDLVLTTYGTLRRDVPALREFEFDYVILDEAQAIKNAETATSKAVRLLRADHRLALTGTPVENHLGELQSLFDFLNPGLLGRGRLLDVSKSSDSAAEAEYVARVAKGLRPFFLRRTKEQVAPELPSRTEETLYCEMEGEQRQTYEELRSYYQQMLLKKIERDGLAKSKLQILEALLRLRQAACHTGLLASAGAVAFARAAADKRIPRDKDGENGVHSSAKFDLLLPRLAELVQEGRKALVFSQFTSLLALLRKRLDTDDVVYEYLDGQTKDRQARVERFQSDESCRLFLISLKAGGVGLNLTAAEYVFLLDPWWNPAVEMQAIDRTHRIGQTKPVFAYRLVAKETVEERILELQSRKRALADAILDAGTGGLRGLQREDLEQLLS